MFELSSTIIHDIIEALIPTFEPVLIGPQITYMATKCGGCTGTCKGGCRTTCRTSCTTTCKGTCRLTCKSGCLT